MLPYFQAVFAQDFDTNADLKKDKLEEFQQLQNVLCLVYQISAYPVIVITCHHYFCTYM